MKQSQLGGALAAGTLFAATIASAAVAQTLPIESYPYVSGPVTITSCSVNEDKSNSTVTSNSLRINYFGNQQGRKLTSVTFRVRYAGTPVTVTDTGNFDYKQIVTHQFNELGGTPWAGVHPSVCRVVTATFADGQVVNPPYDGPDAMESGGPAPAMPNGAEPPPAPAPAPPAPGAPAPAGT